MYIYCMAATQIATNPSGAALYEVRIGTMYLHKLDWICMPVPYKPLQSENQPACDVNTIVGIPCVVSAFDSLNQFSCVVQYRGEI